MSFIHLISHAWKYAMQSELILCQVVGNDEFDRASLDCISGWQRQQSMRDESAIVVGNANNSIPESMQCKTSSIRLLPYLGLFTL